MKPGLRVFGSLLLSASWLLGCGGGDDDGGGGDTGDTGDTGDDGGGDGTSSVSFSLDIAPVLNAKCVWCHTPNSAIALDFTNRDGFVGVANTWTESGKEFVVDPGNPDNSFILTKASETSLDPETEGSPMPYQVPAVEEAERETIEAWIAGGAMDDASFDAVQQIFGTAVTLNVDAAGKCSWCHYPGSPPPGMNILDVFNPVTGLVNAPSEQDSSRTRVIPGDEDNSLLIDKIEGPVPFGAQMPFHPERMTADEIAALTTWIADGAPDN